MTKLITTIHGRIEVFGESKETPSTEPCTLYLSTFKSRDNTDYCWQLSVRNDYTFAYIQLTDEQVKELIEAITNKPNNNV